MSERVHGPESACAELSALNEELARLLGRPPAPLVTGADGASRDPLIVCGLLGGKDVGKSTLINALAGQEISVDREEVGAGTSRPLVYVHRDMVATARARLAEVAPALPATELQFFPHGADAIRELALVDLPDFDSDFRQHEAIARAVAPSLDRVLWVITPRKIADRAWVAFARDVVKASTNIYFALNKSDELLVDEPGWPAPGDGPAQVDAQASRFLDEQRAWACRVLQEAGYAVQPDGMFLLAARYPRADLFVERVAAIWDDPEWRQYAPDRPLVAAIGELFAGALCRLREIVLTPVDPEMAVQIKRQNLLAQIHQNVLRLREHFDLAHWAGQLSRVLDPEYRQALLNSAFGPEVCRTLAARLLRSRRADVEIADEIMDSRAGRWPILRVIYWLSRWAIRRLGRALTGGPRTLQADPTVPTGSDLFRVRARTLADRVELVSDRLRTDHGPLIRQLRLAERLPEPEELAAQAEAELAELPLRGDEELIDRLTTGYRPGLAGRALVWAVLAWFPFIQPVAEGMLEMSAAGTQLTGWLHGLYRVVFALGAVQLLHGFAVVAVIDIALLAAIYARCVREVQAARTRPGTLPSSRTRPGVVALADTQEEVDVLSQEIDGILLVGLIAPLLRPFESTAAQFISLEERLDRIRA